MESHWWRTRYNPEETRGLWTDGKRPCREARPSKIEKKQFCRECLWWNVFALFPTLEWEEILTRIRFGPRKRKAR